MDDLVCGLDNADLSGAEDTSLEHETNLLNIKDSARLLAWHGNLEVGLVQVGIEFFVNGVVGLDTITLEGLEKLISGHANTNMQVLEVLVRGRLCDLISRDVLDGHGEDIGSVEHVLGEFLDSIILGVGDFLGGTLTQVLHVGEGAQQAILF